MTLIPLMSAMFAAPRRSEASAGPAMLRRESYDPGSGYRPVAAAFAIGLPAALVVAVALSPMIITKAPRTDSGTWTSILVDPPKPDPKPDPKPQSDPVQTTLTAPPSPLPPVAEGPVEVPPLPPYAPPAGTGTGSGPDIVVDPPLPPKPFVLAKLDPRYAGSFQPDYPAREQREGIEGVAKVRVLIGTDGKVKAVELVSTDSPGFFDETKRRALAKWRFKPATRGGVAEESWQTMTVRFQIRNA